VFVDDGNDEDRLPDFFDTNIIHERRHKKNYCMLCLIEFGGFGKLGVGKKRLNCKKCGISVCELCSQTSRRLSKMDKKSYKVCDRCDHSMSNTMFKDNLKNDIRSKIET